MARKGALLIIGIIFLVVVGGGLVGVDTFLKTNFDIGLMDIVSAITDSGNTLEDAPSLEELSSSISSSTYSQLTSEKNQLTGAFTAASGEIGQISENQELVDMLNQALGSEYNIYIFTVTNVGGVDLKVFEWTMRWANSEIAVFEEGMTLSTYNVKLQVDQSIVTTLFAGDFSPENIADWVKNKKLKINPITEVTRIVTVLPQLFSMIQSS